jgi:hypothetical protein
VRSTDWFWIKQEDSCDNLINPRRPADNREDAAIIAYGAGGHLARVTYRHTRAPIFGPVWGHTLCAMANDLRFYERLAVPRSAHSQRERLTAMFWGSSGRRFNPVSPTRK